VDRWGNAVSITYTINDYYGSAAAVNGAGFLLNNENGRFCHQAGVPNLYGLLGGDANAVEPTSVVDHVSYHRLERRPVFLVLGSPGGAASLPLSCRSSSMWSITA
jgi:gamma-glutamyltranspeptidase/glutathione hydrolase